MYKDGSIHVRDIAILASHQLHILVMQVVYVQVYKGKDVYFYRLLYDFILFN